MTRRLLPLLLLVLLSALAVPAAAQASGAAVIRDCGDDGKLSKKYSQSDLRDALRDLPTDVDEYTDCRDVIRDARLANAGGGGGGSTGDGGTGGGTGGSGVDDPTAGAGGLLTDPLKDASPAERDAVSRAVQGGSKPVTVGGKVIEPGEVGLGTLSNGGDVPAPLIGVIALLGAALLAGLAMVGRRYLAARRGDGPLTA